MICLKLIFRGLHVAIQKITEITEKQGQLELLQHSQEEKKELQKFVSFLVTFFQ